VSETFDLRWLEDCDAMEANLNDVAASYAAAERALGLPYGLEIGRRRLLIRAAREGICTWCETRPDDGVYPWRCKCGRVVQKAVARERSEHWSHPQVEGESPREELSNNPPPSSEGEG
jgi:hypothetical protein